jgi:hypothetical protein
VSLSNRNGVVNVDARGRARIAVSNSNGIPLTIRLSARFLGLGSIAVPGHSRRVITMQLSRHDLRVLRSRRAARVRLSIEAIDVWDVIANLRPRVLLVA